MGDQFEQFIMENKASFDDASPSDRVWNQIEKRVDRKGRFLQIAWKVAAMLFLASTVYLLVDKNLRDSQGPELSQEFVQAEDYYTQLINIRRTEIQSKLSPEEQKAFLVEIDQLDSMYLELKKTYQVNAANDRLVDAMINNLQLRLEILNKQLEILENINEQNNESDPTIEI